MLYNFHDLVQKHNMNLKGVLHIGAHECEELPLYETYLSRDKIIWIDALPEKIDFAKNAFPGIQIIEAAVSDTETEATFYRANNGQSSSLLEMDTHRHHYPHIFYVNEFKLTTKRVDNLLKENYPDFSFNFINLDIQGMELPALKGMESYLENVDYIYTEVNLESLYKGATIVDELDDYLNKFGFVMMEKAITEYQWGDVLYVKQKQQT